MKRVVDSRLLQNETKRLTSYQAGEELPKKGEEATKLPRWIKVVTGKNTGENGPSLVHVDQMRGMRNGDSETVEEQHSKYEFPLQESPKPSQPAVSRKPNQPTAPTQSVEQQWVITPSVEVRPTTPVVITTRAGRPLRAAAKRKDYVC